MNGRRRARAAGAALAVIAVVTVVIGPNPAWAEEPSVRIDRTGTKAGERLFVLGTGWPGGVLVLVELCGHAALGGSVDCDTANGQLVSTRADGRFFSSLLVALPPRPCPCVVRAIDQSRGVVRTATIAVQGMVTVPLDSIKEPPLPVRAIQITGVRLEGFGPWTAWFGARAERTLTFTLRNIGNVELRGPPLAIAVGTGADPTGIVDPPEVGNLKPDERRSYRVPVRTGPFALGRYTVRVEAHGFVTPVVGLARTWTAPWGLIALAVLLAGFAVLRLRNVRRRVIGPVPVPAVIDLADVEIDLEPTGSVPSTVPSHVAMGIGLIETEITLEPIGRVPNALILAAIEKRQSPSVTAAKAGTRSGKRKVPSRASAPSRPSNGKGA